MAYAIHSRVREIKDVEKLSNIYLSIVSGRHCIWALKIEKVGCASDDSLLYSSTSAHSKVMQATRNQRTVLAPNHTLLKCSFNKIFGSSTGCCYTWGVPEMKVFKAQPCLSYLSMHKNLIPISAGLLHMKWKNEAFICGPDERHELTIYFQVVPCLYHWSMISCRKL